MNSNKPITNQAGFSLIEILLAMAIVAALTVAAFVVYPRVQASRIASEEMNTLVSAKAGIQALFPTGNYKKITENIIRQAEIFPKHMVQNGPTGRTFRNRWGAAGRNVHISGSSENGTNISPTSVHRARFFIITYNDVPTDVCIRMAGMAVNHFDAVFVNAANSSSVGLPVINPYSANERYRKLNEPLIAEQCKGTNGKANISFMSR